MESSTRLFFTNNQYYYVTLVFLLSMTDRKYWDAYTHSNIRSKRSAKKKFRHTNVCSVLISFSIPQTFALKFASGYVALEDCFSNFNVTFPNTATYYRVSNFKMLLSLWILRPEWGFWSNLVRNFTVTFILQLLKYK